MKLNLAKLAGCYALEKCPMVNTLPVPIYIYIRILFINKLIYKVLHFDPVQKYIFINNILELKRFKMRKSESTLFIEGSSDNILNNSLFLSYIN